VKPSRKNIILKTANGGEMKHYGEKEVTFKNGVAGHIIGLRLQVTDVKKPLLSVRRLTEKGNIVRFSDEPGGSYVENVATGKRIAMEKRGGSFVIRAQFVKQVAESPAGFARPAQ
jgi:hypothetical protein